MVKLTGLNIGIIHNTYLKKGGEDQVAENEYQLLIKNNLNAYFLKFQNPEGRFKQFFTFINLPFNVVSFFRCYKWFKRYNINVLHVHNWFFTASPSILWAAKLCKVKVIITIHNYRMICPTATLTFNGNPFNESINNDFSWKAIKQGVYRNSTFLTFYLVFSMWLNNKIGTWKLVEKYIILTQHSKTIFEKSYLDYLSKKLIIKPNFVPECKLLNQQINGNHFLFVGRLSVDKGVMLMLSAFKNTQHQLRIIGEGPLQNVVEAFANENENITYLGFQNKEFIDQQLNLCSALLFPSVGFETFGLIMIEAFASSVPVIASNYSSAALIVQHEYNGLHFENGNLQELKKILDEWASLDVLVKIKYKQNAHQTYLNSYTAEKNLEQLIQIYQSGFIANKND
ncbi:glycosyltransferase family 4 protein [Pedobacter mucosus]|uniref:glycosyltransferase family 4 protein n=1 Tax=Pedobacter mucosus TaxID=2895286 RepID=UPI001EE3F95D|nr:glycosyltransferase family 4 protein [Pedobacter mucosus]UKT63952.1 glycosyltransferase family 4 protein [Pedobacter mucosus]